MELTTSFLSLCGRSFMWWLLTNSLGAILVYTCNQLFVNTSPNVSAENLFTLVFHGLILGFWFTASFASAIILSFCTLPLQLWALATRLPQERRGRFLLVISAPFSLLAAGQIIWWNYEKICFVIIYFLACLFAAGLVYRRWL